MPKAILLVLAVLLAIVWSGAVLAQDQSAVEFNRLIQELNRQQKSMAMTAFIDRAETGLLDFIKKYPATESTGSARLTLGQLYMSLGRYADALDHLGKYEAADYPKKKKEEMMVGYVTGNCYLAMEKFDEAEASFKKLAGSGGDAQFQAQVTRTLQQIGILRKLTIGSPAIDFETRDIEGKALKLSDYRGKVVLIDFWATWCAPCRKEMPNVKKVYSQYHKKGFDIIGISLDNDRGSLDSYIKDNGMAWRQIFDGKGWQSELAGRYAVSSIPATFLLDRQGKIRYKNLHGEELSKSVAKLLSE